MLTDPQLGVHLLASIHPTYRASTSPFSLLPSSYSHAPTEAPSAAYPVDDSGNHLSFDELKSSGTIEGRRKANAVFVVLGEHFPLAAWRQLTKAFSAKF